MNRRWPYGRPRRSWLAREWNRQTLAEYAGLAGPPPTTDDIRAFTTYHTAFGEWSRQNHPVAWAWWATVTFDETAELWTSTRDRQALRRLNRKDAFYRIATWPGTRLSALNAALIGFAGAAVLVVLVRLVL